MAEAEGLQAKNAVSLRLKAIEDENSFDINTFGLETYQNEAVCFVMSLKI
jgi:hypothetical protein